MVNFIKNIIPSIFSYAGALFTLVTKVFEIISALLYNISVTLHMQFNTETGKKLKEIEEATASILKHYSSIANRVTAQKQAYSEEENRLAKIIKENKNVVQLGNKKDDDTQS